MSIENPRPKNSLRGLAEGKVITYAANRLYFDLHVTAVDGRDLPIVKVQARSTDSLEQYNVAKINEDNITGVLLGCSRDDLDIKVHEGVLLPNETPILQLVCDGEFAYGILPVPESPPHIHDR